MKVLPIKAYASSATKHTSMQQQQTHTLPTHTHICVSGKCQIKSLTGTIVRTCICMYYVYESEKKKQNNWHEPTMAGTTK